jgi:hypothetical protein
MSWEEEVVIRDVTNAGIVVSDRIGREVAAQIDLEEALEASRYASHPYSTHPREARFASHSKFLSFNNVFPLFFFPVYLRGSVKSH